MERQGKMMTALFRNFSEAEESYRDLLNRGFRQDEITVITSEETRDRYFSTNSTAGDPGNRTKDATTERTSRKIMEGTGVGAAIGGTMGAIFAALAALGTSLLIPGLWLVIAGPLAAALAGAGAGGAAGGIIGALVGSGIPETTAATYETGLREGGIILGFIPRNLAEANEVERVWERNNGEMIYH